MQKPMDNAKHPGADVCTTALKRAINKLQKQLLILLVTRLTR